MTQIGGSRREKESAVTPRLAGLGVAKYGELQFTVWTPYFLSIRQVMIEL